MKVPRQFTNLYYITNYAVLAAFFGYLYPFLLRPAALSTPLGRKKLQSMGYTSFTSEQEVFGMVLLSLALKAKRCRTGDEILSKFLTHAKILSLLLSYVAGSQVTVGALVLLYALMYVVVQPPRFKGDRKITLLNPYTFSSRVRDAMSQEDKNKSWIVAFWASWCPDCFFFEPILADLSLEYSSTQREFGLVDLELYPELAEQFAIDKSTSSSQLPTLILFHKGKEVRRLPAFKDDGKVKKTILDKKGVIKYFELDRTPSETSYSKKQS